MKIRNYIFTIILLIVFQIINHPILFSTPGAENTRKILYLNSYHKGYKWSDDIVTGIENYFKENDKKNNISIFIEYMDTKRNFDGTYLKLLHTTYLYKYKNIKFDLIISSDDNALNFLIEYKDKIFPNIPVVFCGANYIEKKHIKNKSNITGVNEKADIKESIDLALNLHPNTKTIYIINDQTTTGKKVHKQIQKIESQYKNRISFQYLHTLSMREILQRVSKLPSDSLILYSFLFKDAKGTLYEFNESISLISKYSNRPIYGTWDFNLGYGIVGGKLTSGYYQGFEAARISHSIIKGKNINDIKIIMKSPNQYMFDYNYMLKYGLNKSQLPNGSIIINKPYSLYENHKTLIWGSFIIFSLLVMLTAFLLTNVHNRKKAEKALKFLNDELETIIGKRTKELAATNTELSKKNIQMKKDLGIARSIQQAILPTVFPLVNSLNFEAAYLPMDDLGGDYYDIFEMDNHRFGIVLADVSGHGVAASLITTMAKISFSTNSSEGGTSGEIVRKVSNDILKSLGSLGQYLSCFYGIIDIHEGTLEYTNAGHCTVLLMRQNNEIIHLESNTTIIGAFDVSKFPSHIINLDDGDKLILYTDGITELKNNQREEFGIERLERELLQNSNVAFEHFVSNTMNGIMQYKGNARIDDDITLMVIAYSLEPEPDNAELEKIIRDTQYDMTNFADTGEIADTFKEINRQFIEACASYKEKEYSNAISMLKNLVGKFTRNRDIFKVYYMLGFCHYMIGNSNEANINWESALKIFPDHNTVKRNLYILKKNSRI